MSRAQTIAERHLNDEYAKDFMTIKPTPPSAWPGLMPTTTHDNAPPRADLMNPQWRYTPANKTDVRATWARFGWKPTAK